MSAVKRAIIEQQYIKYRRLRRMFKLIKEINWGRVCGFDEPFDIDSDGASDFYSDSSDLGMDSDWHMPGMPGIPGFGFGNPLNPFSDSDSDSDLYDSDSDSDIYSDSDSDIDSDSDSDLF